MIFDLDDTISKEILYLESAYYEIAQFINSKIKQETSDIFSNLKIWYQSSENVFQKAIDTYQLGTVHVTIKNLLNIYRNHSPNIKLTHSTSEILQYCKHKDYNLGLLTDGRSIQQRSKIKALGLETYFQEIIISEEFGSEKPHPENYKHFESIYGKGQYYYIGDNTSKDFITPNALGWISVCVLDDSRNIHKQNFTLDNNYLPRVTLKSLDDLVLIL